MQGRDEHQKRSLLLKLKWFNEPQILLTMWVFKNSICNQPSIFECETTSHIWTHDLYMHRTSTYKKEQPIWPYSDLGGHTHKYSINWYHSLEQVLIKTNQIKPLINMFLYAILLKFSKGLLWFWEIIGPLCKNTKIITEPSTPYSF